MLLKPRNCLEAGLVCRKEEFLIRDKFPNFKHQAPNKLQELKKEIPILQRHFGGYQLELGYCLEVGNWRLELNGFE